MDVKCGISEAFNLRFGQSMLWEAQTEVVIIWCSEFSLLWIWTDFFSLAVSWSLPPSHLSYITCSPIPKYIFIPLNSSLNCLYAIFQRCLIISYSYTFSPPGSLSEITLYSTCICWTFTFKAQFNASSFILWMDERPHLPLNTCSTGSLN